MCHAIVTLCVSFCCGWNRSFLSSSGLRVMLDPLCSSWGKLSEIPRLGWLSSEQAAVGLVPQTGALSPVLSGRVRARGWCFQWPAGDLSQVLKAVFDALFLCRT